MEQARDACDAQGPRGRGVLAQRRDPDAPEARLEGGLGGGAGAIAGGLILGIAEAIRASGLSAGITDAGLSRGLAGVSGSTLVVNLAGSRYAVRDGMATLNPLAAYIIGQLSSLEI